MKIKSGLGYRLLLHGEPISAEDEYLAETDPGQPREIRKWLQVGLVDDGKKYICGAYAPMRRPLYPGDTAADTTKRPRGRPPGYRAKNPKTSRLITMVTPGTKAEVEAAAKRSGISAGEFVRRAIAAYLTAWE